MQVQVTKQYHYSYSIGSGFGNPKFSSADNIRHFERSSTIMDRFFLFLPGEQGYVVQTTESNQHYSFKSP